MEVYAKMTEEANGEANGVVMVEPTNEEFSATAAKTKGTAFIVDCVNSEWSSLCIV